MSKTKVLTGPERKAQILEAGAKLASKYGASNVTRRMVAKACGCAEGLISNYVGGVAEAQKAYTRKAKSMGLALPDKLESAKLGAKLRAHKPKDARDTRKRSVREVKAIKNKRAWPIKKSVATVSTRAHAVTPTDSGTSPSETKPKPARERKPVSSPGTAPQSPGQAPTLPQRKSAARAPMAPPALPLPPS